MILSATKLTNSLTKIAQYGPYCLPLHIFTASKGSNVLYFIRSIFFFKEVSYRSIFSCEKAYVLYFHMLNNNNNNNNNNNK